MAKLNLCYEELEGVKIGVRLSVHVNEYALQFLQLFNNVRERQSLYSIENNSGRAVWVTMRPEIEGDFVTWVESIGCELFSREIVTVYSVDSVDLFDLDNDREIILSVE